jgi:hypothetical protein
LTDWIPETYRTAERLEQYLGDRFTKAELAQSIERILQESDSPDAPNSHPAA